MQIIPVIDLKDGLVVHAVRGDRSQYQAIDQHSLITDSSEADVVIANLLKLADFKSIYIADLNAICDLGNHRNLINQLLSHYPAIKFWIDDGSELTHCRSYQASNYKTVIGTESQNQPVSKLDADLILSLDFKQDQAAGHADWFNSSQFWPKNIIVMTLNRVGSQLGPDFEKLTDLRRNYPDKTIIAAGGIRDLADLQQLKHLGIDAVLIASALHNGRLSANDLADF
jgi:phosphoribosylformimino-5-aminoimidazole carboxamide ribotide isomerase